MLSSLALSLSLSLSRLFSPSVSLSLYIPYFPCFPLSSSHFPDIRFSSVCLCFPSHILHFSGALLAILSPLFSQPSLFRFPPAVFLLREEMPDPMIRKTKTKKAFNSQQAKVSITPPSLVRDAY